MLFSYASNFENASLVSIRRIRESGAALALWPVIGLTAHVLAEHRAQCLEAGMRMVLTKPVSLADLHRALSDHLPHASLKRSA